MTDLKSAILFPGQGSQIQGMGRDVAEANSDAMELWKFAEKSCGMPLREIFWESGDPVLMADTRSLQPAMTVSNVTLFTYALPYIKRAGFNIDSFAGHSLGEYAALISSGALRADEGIRLVSMRASLMADADPDHLGGMAAVLKISESDLLDLIDEVNAQINDKNIVLLAANRNTPSQTVISGHKSALDLLGQKVKEKRGRMIQLQVSGAFHSPMMEHPSKKLSEYILSAQWSTPKYPVYPNSNPVRTNDRDKLRYALVDQMTSPVFWVSTIRNMRSDGIEAFIEIGPKGVLSKMVVPNLNDIETSESLSALPIINIDCIQKLEELP